jgi:hypothetical protein
MNRPKLFRVLRIGWSVWWGLVAALLCVLWVRSYWWVDVVVVPLTKGHYLSAASPPGCIGGVMVEPSQNAVPNSAWMRMTINSNDYISSTADDFKFSRVWGGFYFGPSGYVVPNWCCILLCAVLGAAPWGLPSRLRFSLRTLLIATTLIALGLGAIVWLSR